MFQLLHPQMHLQSLTHCKFVWLDNIFIFKHAYVLTCCVNSSPRHMKDCLEQLPVTISLKFCSRTC